MLDNSTVETKFCERCLEVKPITEFRTRTRSGTDRMRECNACHNEYERLRRAKHSRNTEERHVSRFVREVKNERDQKRVVLLCNAVISHFGGVQRFIDAWLAQMDRVRREQPLGKKACDFYLAVARLIETTNAFRESAPYREYTAHQLDVTLSNGIEDLLRTQPELVMMSAKQLGWTVVPPGKNRHAIG